MQLTITIPVKPHVKKYLVKNYGLEYKLNKRDALSIVLWNMLRRPTLDSRRIKRLERCTELFSVDVSAFRFFKEGCRHLDAYTIVQFNSFVEDNIETEFCSYVDNLVVFGIEQKEAIAAFMAKYDLDETDIKFDTLKKAYQRYRAKQDAANQPLVSGIAFVPYVCAMKVFSSRKKTKVVTKNAA